MIQHFSRLARTASVCPKLFLRSNKMLTDICMKLSRYQIDRNNLDFTTILTTKEGFSSLLLPQTTISTEPKRGGTAWAPKLWP